MLVTRAVLIPHGVFIMKVDTTFAMNAPVQMEDGISSGLVDFNAFDMSGKGLRLDY